MLSVNNPKKFRERNVFSHNEILEPSSSFWVLWISIWFRIDHQQYSYEPEPRPLAADMGFSYLPELTQLALLSSSSKRVHDFMDVRLTKLRVQCDVERHYNLQVTFSSVSSKSNLGFGPMCSAASWSLKGTVDGTQEAAGAYDLAPHFMKVDWY